MKLLRKCCYCCSLRTGSILVGIYLLQSGLFWIAVPLIFTFDQIFIISLCIIGSANFIGGATLIAGLYLDNLRIIMASLHIAVLTLTLQIVWSIFDLLFKEFLVLNLIVDMILLGTQLYCIVVIFSYYLDPKKIEVIESTTDIEAEV